MLRFYFYSDVEYDQDPMFIKAFVYWAFFYVILRFHDFVFEKKNSRTPPNKLSTGKAFGNRL